MKKLLVILLLTTVSLSAFAQTKKTNPAVKKQTKKTELLEDINSLGSNEDIAKRSKAIDAENRIQVVQNRTVDRTMRFEANVGYDFVAGGDPYIYSNSLGLQGEFHLSNKISLGVRYYNTTNRLSAEGERVFDDYQRRSAMGDNSNRPAVDYPLSTTLGVVTFYPLYGKINFFNLGVTQFDIYVLVGYGQISLNSGNTSTWTAGGGIAFWWSQHLTSKFEARYQGYKDQIYSGARDEGIAAFSASLGFLL